VKKGFFYMGKYGFRESLNPYKKPEKWNGSENFIERGGWVLLSSHTYKNSPSVSPNVLMTSISEVTKVWGVV